MLAPILSTKDGRAQVAPEAVAAAIHAAATNTAKVMPPRAAKYMRDKLLKVANSFTAHRTWFTVSQWADLIDEINAYAARATEFVEHEVYGDGTDPSDASFAAPSDSRDEALAWGGDWWPGLGVAHRTVTRLYGPWEIDRPAKQTKESAA
jgi:hypothetical protein